MAADGDGGGVVRALTAVEWEQIETISHQTRRVGQLMATMGAAQPPDDATPEPFDTTAWRAFTELRVPTPLGTKAKNKKEGILLKLRQKQEEDDLREIRSGRCPTMEKFGGRAEPFLAALVYWSHRIPPTEALDAVVSLHHASINRDDAPRRALEAAADRACSRAGGALALAKQAATASGSRHLVSASFHGVAPLRLYPEQLEVAEEVRSAVVSQQPLLLRFITPPSGGKSSAAALIGATVRAAVGECVFVIYACFSNPVRVDVARVVLAASVPFAIASRGLASPAFCCYFQKPKKLGLGDLPPPDLEGRVAYSLRLMNKCDRKPTVLVCDLESARAFSVSFPGSVLILDELTTASDANLEVMAAAPACTVLASATVPPFERMPAIVEHFTRRHRGTRIASVSSKRLAVSIVAKDAMGKSYFPHQFSPNPILGESHLERFYGPEALCVLAAEMPQEELEWRDVVSHDSIRAACLRLLAHREWTGPPTDFPATGPLGCHNLATELAHHFPGFSLVVLPRDPESFYNESLVPLLANQLSLKRLRDEHLRAAAAETKQQERRLASERRDEAPRQTIEVKSQWWPRESVINSREHQMAWTGGSLLVEPKLSLPLPEALIDTSASPLVEASLSGAVLLETRRWGDRAFELAALALSEQGLPSFVVADKRIIYGVNFPVVRVLVLLEAAELGYDQLRQLCGRAGRTGRASYGEVVFRDAAALVKALSPPPPETDLRAPLDQRFHSKWGGVEPLS
jgi:hypothetical protein